MTPPRARVGCTCPAQAPPRRTGSRQGLTGQEGQRRPRPPESRHQGAFLNAIAPETLQRRSCDAAWLLRPAPPLGGTPAHAESRRKPGSRASASWIPRKPEAVLCCSYLVTFAFRYLISNTQSFQNLTVENVAQSWPASNRKQQRCVSFQETTASFIFNILKI